MSNYIPGNQKHLTLNDRLTGFQIGITRVLFITQRTFVFIVTIAKRPTPVGASHF